MSESQREERNDGLVPVKCPYCKQLWYRMQPSTTGPLHEIRCPKGYCRRIVLFRVDNGVVEDVAATQL